MIWIGVFSRFAANYKKNITMKKFYLVSILSLSLGFIACSDDDDSSSDDDMMEEGETGTCMTCILNVAGLDLSLIHI